MRMSAWRGPVYSYSLRMLVLVFLLFDKHTGGNKIRTTLSVPLLSHVYGEDDRILD